MRLDGEISLEFAAQLGVLVFEQVKPDGWGKDGGDGRENSAS